MKPPFGQKWSRVLYIARERARSARYDARIKTAGALGGVLAIAVILAVLTPPPGFPHRTLVRVEPGAALSDVSRMLSERGLIRSKKMFLGLAILMGGERGVIAGAYLFTEPANMLAIARRLTSGDYGDAVVRVTIPEGFSSREIALLFSQKLESFDTERFRVLAGDREGYLFPDTYFLSLTAGPEDVLAVMEANFERRISSLNEEIRRFGRSRAEIITMASIIELEAPAADDRRIISGILWERLRIGMPLQVDAAFVYINGKGSRELTVDDLALDSPYNTYRYRGLPKGPIGNPGLDAIEAALRPTKTPYLYYLSDSKGTMHYARTFEEHKRNRERYLERE